MERKSGPVRTTEEEDDHQDDIKHRCGIGRFKPRWLQRFADPKVYLVIFCTVGVLEGAYFTYFVGVLTTLEKRFAFESKISGVIFIADNLSATVISLLVGYYGQKWHKPRTIAFGMVVVALSCFMCTVPYFMYGPALHFLTSENFGGGGKKREYCEVKADDCATSQSSSTIPVIVILFLANLLWGFGYSAYYTVGAPYLDDNVKKKNAPMYFSAMAALRIFGPTLGFLLSSFCLKYYEDPFFDPGVGPESPRWVGAWWMGFFILGAAIFFFTVLLALFPRELPGRFRSEKKKEKEEVQLPRLKDFPQAIKRLMKNPILVCHVISITFQVNGFAGYFVFMPKFFESQYQKSASDASLFSGATGILSMLLGVLLGGFMIKKFKPRPRYLTGYMVLVEIFSVLGLFASMFLGCDPIRMTGTSPGVDRTLDLYNECNAKCGCTQKVFEPVCAEDGTSTFFSPCYAGCLNSSISYFTENSTDGTLSNRTMYHDCTCAQYLNSTYNISNVTSGYCSTGCNMFIVYIILLCISKFISSTARVGNTLITFRCVDAKDKSFAIGVFGSVLAMFAFIPYPLIYGALTDSTCLVWEESCSGTGNCWLYDSDKFRLYLHGMSILLIGVGILFDVAVFLMSDRLTNFYGEDDGDDDRAPAGGAREEVRWIKDGEEEDVIFAKAKDPTLDMKAVL